MSITKTILYRQLHGSISEVYQDLPGSDIPTALSDAIPKAAVEILAYQDRNTPRNHSFLRIRAGNKDLALRAMCAQKHSSIAQTCYAQKYLLELTPQLLLDNFDDVLGIGFYTEDGFNLAATNAHGTARDYSWNGGDTGIRIDPDVLRGVLFGMVNCWRRGTDPVIIAVPDGVDYDQYTFRAVSAIYACLPAALRLLAGFMTYADPGTQSSGMALCFLPASYNHSQAVFLDGSGSGSTTKALLDINMPHGLKTLISDLAAMSDSERQQALKDISTYVESAQGAFVDLGKLHWSSYTNYWSLRGLSNLDPDQTDDFEALRKFSASADSVPADQKAELSRIIQDQVKTDHLDKYFLNKAKTASTLADFYKQILPYLPLCRIARTNGRGGDAVSRLEDHVWKAFWNFCKELAQKQTDMDGLNQLHDAIADIIRANRETGDEGPDQASIEFEEPYRSAYSARKADFLKDELAAIETALHKDIREKCTVLGQNPDKIYTELTRAFLKDLPAGLDQSDKCVTQVLENAKKTLLEARMAYTNKLLEWFDKGLNPDLDTLTSAKCQELAETMAQKKESDIFKNAPADIRKKIEKHGNDLMSSFSVALSKSSGYFNEIKKEINDLRKNYFTRLAILAREQQAQTLSEDDCKTLYTNFLAHTRPKSWNAYTAEFSKYCRQPISICTIAPFESTLGLFIARDIKILCDPGQPHTINVSGKTLSQLAEDTLSAQLLHTYLTGDETKIVLKSQEDSKKVEINADALKAALNGFMGRPKYEFKCTHNELQNLVVLLTRSTSISDTDLPNVMAYLKAFGDSEAKGHGGKNLYAGMLQQYLTITAYQCKPAELDKKLQDYQKNKQRIFPLPPYRSPREYYQLVAESYDALERVGLLDDQTQLHLKYVSERDTLDEFLFPLKKLYNTLRFYLGKDTSPKGILPVDSQKQILPLLIIGATPEELPALTYAVLNLHHRYSTMQQTDDFEIPKWTSGRNKVGFDQFACKCIQDCFTALDPDEQTRLGMYYAIKEYSRYCEKHFNDLPNKVQDQNSAERLCRYLREYRTFCKVFAHADITPDIDRPFAEGGRFRKFWNKITGKFRKSSVNNSDTEQNAAPDTDTDPNTETDHNADTKEIMTPEPQKKRRLWVIPAIIAPLALAGVLIWYLYCGMPGFPFPTDPTRESTAEVTVPVTTAPPDVSEAPSASGTPDDFEDPDGSGDTTDTSGEDATGSGSPDGDAAESDPSDADATESGTSGEETTGSEEDGSEDNIDAVLRQFPAKSARP